MHPIDAVQLRFDPGALIGLNIILGLIMFGVALELTLEDFKRALSMPRAFAVGLFAQFLLMPAVTFVLAMAVAPSPSIALGMLLVASCPGGNVSNFLTSIGKGNTAVSVSMTAISTAAAVITTPLNLSFWGSLNPETAAILTDLSMSPVEMLKTVFILLAVPLTLGMTLRHYRPTWAERLTKPFKVLSVFFLFAIIVGAFNANFDHFIVHISTVFVPVMLQNALALSTGFFLGKLAGLDVATCRALAVEVGIQNSGLGLILVFNFFGGLGGMAVICGWWGIWHILAGLALTFTWSQLDQRRGALV